MKKKIAFIGLKYFPSKGGTGRAVEYLVSEFKERYDITIYCYKKKENENQRNDINIVHIPEMPFGNLGIFVYFLICAFHALLKGNYDIVHVHKTDLAIIIPILRLKYKVVATSHEAPYRREKWSFFIGRMYLKIMERIFVHSSAKLTCVSKTLTDYYNSKYKVNVKFVPTMVEPRNDLHSIDANQLLVQYNLNSEFIVFAARRIIPTKGLHTLLSALIKIEYKGKIVVVGDSLQMPEYTARLKKLSTELDVTFVGFIGEPKILLSLIKKAKLFIFPSEIEAMSMMLLEVAAVKTPIISSDIPENTTVFNKNEVTFFKNKDVDDLAKVMKYSLNNIATLEAKSSIAYKKVREKYSLSKVAAMYESIYLELINN